MRRKASDFELGEAESIRWYILWISFVIFAVQSSNWFTFSSIPDKVEDYYHLSKPGENKVNGVIDLLLNWGPICFLPVTPFSAYLLSYPIIGLKYTANLAATLVFFGAFIRCIPTFLDVFNIGNYQINNNLWHTLIFLHFGQILTAIAGPLVMSPPPKLSVIWFPENQRTIATSIGVSAGVFGTCFSFLIGPLIGDIPTLLYIDLILAFIPFVCVWIYFPLYPSKLPSVAAVDSLLSTSMSQININNKKENLLSSVNIQNDIQEVEHDEKPSFLTHFGHFVYELKELILNPSAISVTLVGGLMSGVYSGWSGVFQDMLDPLGIDDADIGVIGFNFNATSFIGGIIFGYIADKWFHKKLRKLIVIGLILTMIILSLLLFIIPSPWSNDAMIIIHKDDSTMYKMVILNILIGLLGLIGSGGITPLFYELVAGISFPVTEGTSSTLLVFLNNLSCLVFVGIGNWINTTWETLLALLMCSVSMVLMLLIKEEYKRK